MKRSLAALGGLLVVIVMIGAGALAWLDSRAGKAWLEAAINEATDGTARITAIGGRLPFHPSIERIELSDESGTWARIDDIHLDFSADLVRWRVVVQRLSAATVEIHRMPVGEPEATSDSPGFSMPQLPVGVAVEHFAVDSLRLPPELLGQATPWKATAAAHLIGRDVGLDVQLEELGPSPLQAELRLELSDQQASAHATIADPRGLLSHRAMGEALPLHVSLTDDPDAAHSLADWRGRLTTTIGDRARADASLRLATGTKARRFEAHGTVDAARLLPAAFAPLVGDAVAFRVAAHETTGGGVALEHLTLETASLRANGGGSYHPKEGLIDSSLRITLSDLRTVSDLAGQPLAGSGVLALAAKGTLDTLHAEAELHASRVRAGTMGADEIVAKFEAAAVPAGFEIKGGGQVAGVRAADAPLPAHLGEAIGWQLGASIDESANQIRLSGLELSSAGVKIAAHGSLDRAQQDVDATVRIGLDDLRSFAEFATPGLAGRAYVTAVVAGTTSGRATVRIDGAFDDISTGLPAADALIGDAARLRARVHRDDGGFVRFDEAAVDIGAAHASARGTIDLNLNQLDGEVAVTLDDLSVLQQAGLPAIGRLRVDARINGKAAGPSVDAHFSGSNLGWNDIRIDRMAAHVSAKTEDAASGSLTAELQSGGLLLRADGKAALSSDRKVLNVPQLRLRSGTSIVEARLRTVLDTWLTSGQVSANVPDLAPWSSLAGMELGGRVNLKLGLSAPRGGQSAEIALAADDLRIDAPDAGPVAVRRITANGTLSDMLRRPSGRIDVAGDQIAAATGRIDAVRFTTRSTEPNRFAFAGNLNGDFKSRITLATDGELRLDRGTHRVTLRQLSGKVGDTPLQLKRPLLVTMAGPAFAFSDLALAVGNGLIEGKARRDDKRLEVDLAGRELPVGLAATLAGRADIAGLADIQIAFGGPAAQPRGRVSIEGRNLRAGPARRTQPAVGFSAVANVAPSQIDVEAALTAAGNRVLTASGVVPMVFGPTPGAVALAEHRRLTVRMRGDGELATFADFLPLAGDRLAGHYRLALDATGALSRPEIAGELSLDRGRYENRASGLVVEALAMHLTADRNRAVLHQITATDGDKGMLEGAGVALFDGTAMPTVKASVSAKGFRALRRSDARLTASGEASVNGPLDALALLARITVDQAEIFIPDPPPTRAKKIPVTVIDSVTGQILERPEEPAPASDGILNLDVAVHVPGRTFIRGRGLDSEWEGDVRIQGTSAAPEITGALKVAKGRFAFFGKDLALTRGTVSFTGGTKIEPDIDVLAETTTADATFQVGASGTPDELKIKLSSNPALPEDEILSRLIFGREMTRLTPAQGLQLAQAAATLANGGPGMLDKVRRKLGLDVLNIGNTADNDSLRPNTRSDPTGGSGGMENTGVSGGKYIGNGVYVGVEQKLSGETRGKFEVEVLPNVNVETSAGVRGESVGIMWKRDY